MPDDGLDPIIVQVTIPLPIPMIYSAFTDADIVDGWMCDEAKIDAKPGGEYTLRWEGDVPFESHGTVTEMNRDVDIGFTWQAPEQFSELLNRPEPKTKVYVRLQESPEGIDVTLEHAGWESGEPWEEARSWHFHLWDDRLHRLKDYLLRVAYG